MGSRNNPRNRLAKMLPEEWRQHLVDNGLLEPDWTAPRADGR